MSVINSRRGNKQSALLWLFHSAQQLLRPTLAKKNSKKKVSIKIFLIIQLALINIIFFASPALSEVSFKSGVKREDGSIDLPIIKIHGQIKQQDVETFHQLKVLAKKNIQDLGLENPSTDKQQLYFVGLDSNGGSVSAAISIGKAIRDESVGVILAESDSCVSACVLLLAGGVTRVAAGRVGVHRPYLEEDRGYTTGSQKKIYAEIEKKVKSYLSYVNVPTSLYDLMFRIPPEKVRFLSDVELQEFNLNEDDPFFKEAEYATAANKVGLTKLEYIKRRRGCDINSQTEKELLDCYVREVYKKQGKTR